MVLLFFPIGAILLKSRSFAELAADPAPAKASTGLTWWIGSLVFAVLPAATLFPFKEFYTKWQWQPTALFAQSITSQIAIWTTLVGLISLTLFLIWHFFLNRKAQPTADHYGLTSHGQLEWRTIGKSFVFALLVVLTGYFTLLLSGSFLKPTTAFGCLRSSR